MAVAHRRVRCCSRRRSARCRRPSRCWRATRPRSSASRRSSCCRRRSSPPRSCPPRCCPTGCRPPRGYNPLTWATEIARTAMSDVGRLVGGGHPRRPAAGPGDAGRVVVGPRDAHVPALAVEPATSDRAARPGRHLRRSRRASRTSALVGSGPHRRTSRVSGGRAAEVELGRRRAARPAAGDHLAARVEPHRLRAVDVALAEQRVLPAAERVPADRHRDRHVDADHADVHGPLERAGRVAGAT